MMKSLVLLTGALILLLYSIYALYSFESSSKIGTQTTPTSTGPLKIAATEKHPEENTTTKEASTPLSGIPYVVSLTLILLPISLITLSMLTLVNYLRNREGRLGSLVRKLSLARSASLSSLVASLVSLLLNLFLDKPLISLLSLVVLLGSLVLYVRSRRALKTLNELL